MMLTTLATTALLAGMTMGQAVDTTMAVRPGVRFEINNFGGEIAVSTWGRNAVRVEAEAIGKTRTVIESGPAVLAVRSVGRVGPPGAVEYRITVPRWMELKLSGVYTEMSVDGTQGAVSVETVRGDVRVSGGRGFVHLASIQGEVQVHGAQGKLELSSVNESVSLHDVEGEITAESVNGDITMSDVRAALVEAASVSGDITYDGAIVRGGRYKFASHSGDVLVAIPSRPNVTVAVSTFNGEFDSAFDVRLSKTRHGQRMNFTLGSGGADLALESFEGSIKLEQSGSRVRARKER